VYYRLKYVGYSGQTDYTHILHLRQNKSSSPGALVYPNPTQDQLQIVLQGLSANNSYELIDQIGRVLLKGSLLFLQSWNAF